MNSALSLKDLRKVALISRSEGRYAWQVSLSQPSSTQTGAANDAILIQARNFKAMRKLRQEINIIRQMQTESILAAPRILKSNRSSYLIEGARELNSDIYENRQDPQNSVEYLPLTFHQDLEQVLKFLHQKDLVLGLRGGRGVGFRPDGTCVVTDFSKIKAATPIGLIGDRNFLDNFLHSSVENAVVARKIDQGFQTEVALRPSLVPGLKVARPKPVTSDFSDSKNPGKTLKTVALIGALSVLITCTLLIAPRFFNESKVSEAAVAEEIAKPEEIVSEPELSPLDQIDAAYLQTLLDLRYSYLKGLQEVNSAAVPNSPLAIQDSQMRQAVKDVEFHGGETRIIEITEIESNAQTLDEVVLHAKFHELPIIAQTAAGKQIQENNRSEYYASVKLKEFEGKWLIFSVEETDGS